MRTHGGNDELLANLTAIDEPNNMSILRELVALDTRIKVLDGLFPEVFDLS